VGEVITPLLNANATWSINGNLAETTPSQLAFFTIDAINNACVNPAAFAATPA
jgi:hypothetical protein